MKITIGNFYHKHQIVSYSILYAITNIIFDIIGLALGHSPKMFLVDAISAIVMIVGGFWVEKHIDPNKNEWNELFAMAGCAFLYIAVCVGVRFLSMYLLHV
ncbi:hypothetical protein OZX58_06090 [Lactobacillus sp. ESL0680]|uniref:hypothetical protein n=1 Tax=Lactobacillus sp. ESL0680 TaxID=2983210 RepID=UPI0023F6FB24|nr:hypothetical protein [Lactobacillus sp. ESL0680]WEV38301.1 hypothetical protein OZX58_06090 [Lactobacillus sp. ESL0680]